MKKVPHEAWRYRQRRGLAHFSVPLRTVDAPSPAQPCAVTARVDRVSGTMELSVGTSALFRLDVGQTDQLGPFLAGIADSSTYQTNLLPHKNTA
jgi:hypothetical protein